MKKIVFLDRDGVLNYDSGYVYEVKNYLLLDGIKQGLRRLKFNDFNFIILTSQSGIGRNLYKESDYQKFMDYLIEDLKTAGIAILGTYYCPHHAEYGVSEYKKDCDCRKPKPGLILQAERVLGPFDYKSSWAIGDKARDLEMAKNASSDIRTILLPKNFGTIDEEPFVICRAADFKADDFIQAVNIILNSD